VVYPTISTLLGIYREFIDITHQQHVLDIMVSLIMLDTSFYCLCFIPIAGKIIVNLAQTQQCGWSAATIFKALQRFQLVNEVIRGDDQQLVL
jgi:hypothetical protein